MDRITRAVAAITAKYPTRRIYGPLDRPSEYNSLVDELPKKIGHTAKNKAVVLYEYRGVSYTMPELAALSGFSPATLRTRIRSGWSMEDVMNRPLDPLHTQQRIATRKYEWPAGSGRKHNIRELAVIAGVAYNTLYDRINAGWSLDRAMGG